MVFNKSSKALDDELRVFKESQASETSVRNQEFALQKAQLEEQLKAELTGEGVDVNLLEQYRKALEGLKALLTRIENERSVVIRYRDAEQNLFAKEPEIKKTIKVIEQQEGPDREEAARIGGTPKGGSQESHSQTRWVKTVSSSCGE